jgi:hypothetical protein
MEWIGVETALALARRFADRPQPGRRLVCLPIVNADGYARVEAVLRAGRRRYVRANAAGVDLNRNFPTHHRRMRWRAWLARPLGTSGSGPASEPETRAVLDLLDAERGRIDRAISLHSFGRKVLVPFGGRWRPPDDLDRVMPLAKDVGARLGYDVVVASHWLPGFGAFGLELDHLHVAGARAILVECSAGGFSFRDPSSWLHPFRWYNPPDPEAQAARIADALVPFAAPMGRAAALDEAHP